ncbi:hypothetical protein DXG01_005832 [Tephrocybe rancida]|nr:hypothetical protein DXG01_005832 [Tephrocybe rancida]
MHGGWTMVHGHFFAMGGFMLYKDGKPLETLKGTAWERMLHFGEIDFPSISAEEIMDRSKGDGLSKAFALVQTIWFIAQCISRYVQHLALAELEVTTLALAAVNAMMYFCWWDKPLNVLYPVRVNRKPDQPPDHDATIRTTPTDMQAPYLVSSSSYDVNSDDERIPIHPVGVQDEGQTHSQWMRRLCAPFFSLRHCILQPLHSFWAAIADALRESSTTGRKCGWEKVLMTLFVYPIMAPMVELTGIGDDNSRLLRVGIFDSTASREYSLLAVFIPVGICGTVFGAIHITAWSSDFPSNAERILWRSAAAIISCEPAVPAIALMFRITEWWSEFSDFGHRFGYTFGTVYKRIVGTIGTMPLLFYVCARILLLTLAITTLRELPPSAFEKVQWSDIFPHI